jgi:hypothetical protein
MKKTAPILHIILLIIAASTFTNCSDSSDPAPTDIYLPDFKRNWINNANPDDQFFFLNAPDNQATGTFTGNEFISGEQVATFEGSFDHSKVSFKLTFLDNSPAKTYTGTMSGTGNRVLTLSSGGQPLVLKQQ